MPHKADIKNKLIKLAYDAIYDLAVQNEEDKLEDLQNLEQLDKTALLDSAKEQLLKLALKNLAKSTDSIYNLKQIKKIYTAVRHAIHKQKQAFIAKSVASKPQKGILVRYRPNDKATVKKQVRFSDEVQVAEYFTEEKPSTSTNEYRESDKQAYNIKREKGILDLFYKNPPLSPHLDASDFEEVKAYFGQHQKDNCHIMQDEEAKNMFVVSFDDHTKTPAKRKQCTYSKKELREIIFGFKLQTKLSLMMHLDVLFTYYGKDSYSSLRLAPDSAQYQALKEALNALGFYAKQDEKDQTLNFDCEELRTAFDKDNNFMKKLSTAYNIALEHQLKKPMMADFGLSTKRAVV